MKQIVLVFTLLAFMIGAGGQSAAAVAQAFFCAPYEKCAVDQDESQSVAAEKNTADFQICPDCGCHHTHVMSPLPAQGESTFVFASSVRFALYETAPSHAASPLYRPPII